MRNLNGLDLTGKRFGLLNVERIYRVKSGIIWWRCKCICGGNIAVKANDLYSVTDCGCISGYTDGVEVLNSGEDIINDILDGTKVDYEHTAE